MVSWPLTHFACTPSTQYILVMPQALHKRREAHKARSAVSMLSFTFAVNLCSNFVAHCRNLAWLMCMETGENNVHSFNRWGQLGCKLLEPEGGKYGLLRHVFRYENSRENEKGKERCSPGTIPRKIGLTKRLQDIKNGIQSSVAYNIWASKILSSYNSSAFSRKLRV